MLSKELLDLVAGYITDDRKEVLEESYRSITEALSDLYFVGVEIQLDERRINQTNLQDLYEKIRDEYGLKVDEDYDSVDFLVCFELGFNEKIAPILRKRGTLKMIYGGLIFAAHRFSGIPVGTTPRLILTEAEVFDELSDAQNARWLCDFRTCFRIIDSLKNRVTESRLSSASKQYWSSNISDLKVEASFTTSNVRNHGRAVTLSDEVINAWGEQNNYVKLTHSYLRKSVLYRQMAFLDPAQKSSLILSLDTLLEAEEEVGSRLIAQKDQDAIRTLFSLYIELAKAYAQTGVFSSAWRFFFVPRENWMRL